jgi:hypothetical protein
VTATVESPIVSRYSKLFNQYPLTLQCTCKKTAVKYEKFIFEILAEYHPICSSAFVSADCLNALVIDRNVFGDKFFGNDFRIYIKAHFDRNTKRIVMKECKQLNRSEAECLHVDYI